MSRVRFGDVAREVRKSCREVSGLRVVGLEHLEPENVTLEQWSESNDNTFSKLFSKGQVLFGRRRAYLKKAALATFDGVCSGDITVIEAIPDALEADLLPFIVQNDAFFDFAVGGSAGSLSPRVKWEHLSQYEFELPTFEEQKKLAQVLWAMERTKRAYKELLKQSSDLAKSQFVEMFGDPVLNEKGWPVKTLPEIGENLDGKRVPITSGNREPGPFPYYGASGIVDYVEGYIFDEDILLISEDGANLLMRSTPIAFPAKGKVWVNNHAHVMRFGDLATQKYVECFLNAISIENYVTGTAQPKLNQARMNSIPIPFPPLSMQRQYAAFIEQLDKSLFALKESLSKLTAAQKALMNQAFEK